VKHADAPQKPFLDRFMKGSKEVPTKQDVEDYKKLYSQMEQMSQAMWADIECQRAMGGFGGPADTWFSSFRQSVNALARRAH
jgi:hypothetical protein